MDLADWRERINDVDRRILALLNERVGYVLNLAPLKRRQGIPVHEPAADLAVVAAVASSLRNQPVAAGAALFGEVGLAGEIRGTTQPGLRVREAAQMGFTRCVMPRGDQEEGMSAPGCELLPVDTVGQALEALFA